MLNIVGGLYITNGGRGGGTHRGRENKTQAGLVLLPFVVYVFFWLFVFCFGPSRTRLPIILFLSRLVPLRLPIFPIGAVRRADAGCGFLLFLISVCQHFHQNVDVSLNG